MSLSFLKSLWKGVIHNKTVKYYDVGEAEVVLFLDDNTTAKFTCKGRVVRLFNEDYITKAEDVADQQMYVNEWITDDEGIRHHKSTIRSYTVTVLPYVIKRES